MNSKLFLLFFISFFFSSLIIYCQTSPISNQIPPTPEVSNLYSYMPAGVSECKGTLDFSINLYSLNTDNVVIPIVLQYNSNGINIEEEASNVGTSWNLSGGGVINRQQFGLPDEFTQGININPAYDSSGYVICQQFSINNFVSYFNYASIANEMGNVFANNSGSLSSYSGPPLNSYYNKNPEPDLFNYVLPNGKRGSFIISSSNQVHCSTNDKIYVYFDASGNISNYTIVDELGNKYFFNEVEKRDNSFWGQIMEGASVNPYPIKPAPLSATLTDFYGFIPCIEGSNNNYNQSSPGAFSVFTKPVNVGWFINKIETIKGNEVNFTYEDERHSRLTNITTVYDETQFNKFENYNRQDNFITKRLIKIEDATCKIFFEYNTSKREDVKGSFNVSNSLFNSSNNYSELRALNSIVIKDKNNIILKNINFVTSYKHSNGIGNSTSANNYLYKRLWLDEVNINDVEKYTFEYYSGSLPHKHSFEQDYWGYFNNNGSDSTNKTLLPDLWFYPNDPRSVTRPTNFSIFRRTNFNGAEHKLSTYSRFSNVLLDHLSNREPNESALKIGMLEKVIYPTKGYQKFYYELNDFLFENELKKGFGLRVKSVESYDNDNSPEKIVTYDYKTSDGNSSGKITSLNNYGRITSKRVSTNALFYSISTKSFFQKSNLYYDRVEKTISNNGRIVSDYYVPYSISTQETLPYNGNFYYINTSTFSSFKLKCNVQYECTSNSNGNIIINNPVNTYEYPTIDLNINYENLFGAKLNEYIFNQSGDILQLTENQYSLSDNSKTRRCMMQFDGKFFGQFVKTFSLGSLELTKSKVTNNFTTSSMVSENHYLYSNGLLREQKYTNSKGEVISTKFDYPDSNLLTFNFDYSDMKALNMLNYPIIVSKFKANELVSKKFNRYDTFTINAPLLPISRGFLVEEFELETNKPITDFNEFNWYDPFLPTFGQMDSRMKSKKKYHRYDLTNGNLIEFSELDGMHTVYLWGYDKTKIIAKIENISFSSIPPATISNLEALSNNDPDSCNSTNCQEQILRNALNNLRTDFPNSMITTYTYDPLVGITSITDPRGEVIYYSYDEFGRLNNVRDKNGNILSENQYHFKN